MPRMILSRRRFFTGVAAAAALAPAIAQATHLAVLKARLWGDGIHDDTEALQAFINTLAPTGRIVLPHGQFLVKRGIDIRLPDRGLLDFAGAKIICTHPTDAAVNFHPWQNGRVMRLHVEARGASIAFLY